jgi:uncharacterized membrane protein
MSSFAGKPDPVVLRIAMADVGEAFSRGLRDFQALAPRDIALASIYVIGGLAIVFCIAAFGMSYLAYRLAAGFALIAPFVAAGFYDLSRQREQGLLPSIRGAWKAIKSHRELGWMAFVTIFGGFNRSAQHLLILRGEEVCHGDVAVCRQTVAFGAKRT